jgi:hypothetical protein
MRIKTSIILVPLVSLFLLVGAAAGQDDQWPQDARDVAATLYQRMIGQYDGSGNVHFNAKGEQALEGGASGGFAGFRNGNIFFLHYENDAAGKAYNAKVLGLFNLSDDYGRFAALRFTADYKVMWRDIMINSSAAVTVSPPMLPVQVYLVPAELVEGSANAEVFDSWTSLYRFAVENAYKAGQEPETRLWYVFSFMMSKLPPDADVDVIVSTKRSSNRSSQNDAAVRQEVLDYAGWRVHAFMTRFKPCSTRGRFYINYYYTPGADVPDDLRERNLVAQFDSKQ